MLDFLVIAIITISTVLIIIAVMAIRHLIITRSNSMSTTQTPHPEFDEHIRKVFLAEIAWQCRLALCSVTNLRQALAALRSQIEERTDIQVLQVNVWVNLQSLLIAASNISKIFWNKREHIKGRGEALRKALEVADDSALEVRNLRNHFEHYDERIDEWALNSKNRNLIDTLIGSPSRIQIGTEKKDWHRIFDPDTLTVWFWGIEYPLNPIIDEIQRIKVIIDRS